MFLTCHPLPTKYLPRGRLTTMAVKPSSICTMVSRDENKVQGAVKRVIRCGSMGSFFHCHNAGIGGTASRDLSMIQ